MQRTAASTNPEDVAVSSIVGPRCFAAFKHWDGIITKLDNGDPVDLTIASPDDIWPRT